MTLTGRPRRQLRARAHALDPVVHVGEAGLTDGVRDEIDRALEAHELIKVRIEVEEGAARRALATKLAAATDAGLAGTIGKIAMLYRAREEKPRIKLPG